MEQLEFLNFQLGVQHSSRCWNQANCCRNIHRNRQERGKRVAIFQTCIFLGKSILCSVDSQGTTPVQPGRCTTNRMSL